MISNTSNPKLALYTIRDSTNFSLHQIDLGVLSDFLMRERSMEESGCARDAYELSQTDAITALNATFVS